MKRVINKIQWRLKQLFPLTYRSHYRDSSNRKRFSVWKMWLGRVYKAEDYVVSL